MVDSFSSWYDGKGLIGNWQHSPTQTLKNSNTQTLYKLESRVGVGEWNCRFLHAIIANIRLAAVPTSQIISRFRDGFVANPHSSPRRQSSHDYGTAGQRMFSMKANKESTVPFSNSNSPLQLNNDSKHTTIRIYRTRVHLGRNAK